MNKKKILGEQKLTYDEIVNVRKDVSEIKEKGSNISVIKFVSFSLVILAIVFGSLILFRVI